MRRFLETCLRQAKWIAVTLVVVPALVGVIGHYFLQSHEAIAAMWADGTATSQTSDPAAKTPGDIYASSLQQLLMTRTFREEVLKKIDARTHAVDESPSRHEALLERIRTGVKVSAQGSNLVQVRYRDSNAAMAIATVSAVVDAFQEDALSLKKTAAQRVANLYQEQVQQARQNVADTQGQLSALPGSAAPSLRAQLTLQLQERQDFLKTLEDQRNQVYSQSIADVAAVPGTLQVIDQPHEDTRSKTNWLYLALAVTGALLITFVVDLGVVAILTLSDQSIHNAADLAALTDVPIAEMPRVHVV